jgi:hypothetical protein
MINIWIPPTNDNQGNSTGNPNEEVMTNNLPDK